MQTVVKNYVCLRVNEKNKNGIFYTEDSFEDLKEPKSVEVTVENSDAIIGCAEVRYVKDKGLVCDIYSNSRTVFEGKKIAPYFEVNSMNIPNIDSIVVKKCKLMKLIICDKHAFKGILKIRSKRKK